MHNHAEVPAGALFSLAAIAVTCPEHVLVSTEKNGIPDHGEPHVDEDYGAISDNDLYSD